MRLAKETSRSDLLHAGFELGILLKGLHAALEVLGGVLLMFVSPELLGGLIHALTQNELAEDPRDYLANLILRASQQYSISTQHFGVMYLLSDGAVQVILVVLLWKKKLWAYPLGVAMLVLFIVFQTARWTSTHSAWLTAFTLLDLVLIWFTIAEYRKLKRRQAEGKREN